ncbi:MAG: dihydrofolate reductase family protein [Kocuria sp.]|nr:dihydrofolate reductase family protein [Kocuria sp.]
MSERFQMQRLWPEPQVVEVQQLREHYARTWPDAKVGAAAMMVASLDGASSLDGLSGGLSSPTDQMLMDVLRSVADVVIVGSATLLAEGYKGLAVSSESAAWRVANGLPPHPVLAVVSGSLQMDPQVSFLAEAPVPPLILTGAQAPPDKVKALSEVADVVMAGEDRHVDPVWAHHELVARGYQRVQCEGGPNILSQWHGAGRIAQLNLTVADAVAGGDSGRILRGTDASPRRTVLRQVLRDGSVLFLQQDLREE